MRNASIELQNFLFSKQGFVFADLYTFVLTGGNVLRWTSAGVPIRCNGFLFNTGPTIRDSGVKQAVGLQVDTIDVTLSADGTTGVNGVPLIKYVRMNGLDGALVTVERCFAANWKDMVADGPVGGSIIRYQGRCSDVKTSKLQATITVSSWFELLDVDMPSDVYQASCLNTLYDEKCKVNRAAFAATGAVDGESTLLTLDTNLSSPDGTYALGSIVFSSGPNSGIRRTVKTQTGGNLILVAPLIETPSIGDPFTIYPGCDLKMGTCSGKFNNLIHFRGQPFIPIPETAI